MDRRTAAVVLRTFSDARAAHPVSHDRAWKWASGVHLFPEAFCPFCKTVMRSPMIWQVDERAQRLVRIVTIAGGMWREMPRRHPHVRGDGTICMNGYAPNTSGASSAAEALFLGMYPMSSMMFGRRRTSLWDGYLAEYFGHARHDAAGLKRRARPKLLKISKPRRRTV